LPNIAGPIEPEVIQPVPQDADARVTVVVLLDVVTVLSFYVTEVVLIFQ